MYSTIQQNTGAGTTDKNVQRQQGGRVADLARGQNTPSYSLPSTPKSRFTETAPEKMSTKAPGFWAKVGIFFNILNGNSAEEDYAI